MWCGVEWCGVVWCGLTSRKCSFMICFSALNPHSPLVSSSSKTCPQREVSEYNAHIHCWL